MLGYGRNIMTILVAALFALALPSHASAASCTPTVNNVQTDQDNGNQQTYTLSNYAVSGSLTDTVLVVTIHSENTGSYPTTVTFNGTNLTKATEYDDGFTATTVWYLLSPAATTADIVADYGGGGSPGVRSGMVAMVLDCVAQQAHLDDVGAAGTAASDDQTLTTGSSMIIVDALTINPAEVPAISYGPDQVVAAAFAWGTGTGAGVSTLYAPDGSGTVGWTWTSNSYSHGAVAFAAKANCDSPTGYTGDIQYNTDRAAVEYCDGENWIMAGIGSYNPNAVTFDGTNDYLSATSLAGAADATTFSASFWIKPHLQGTDTYQQIFVFYNGVDDTFQIGLDDNSSNDDLYEIGPRSKTSAGVDVASGASSETIAAGQWYHVLTSYDGGSQLNLYINDGSDLGWSVINGGTIDFTGNEYGVGGGNGGANILDADIADLWIDVGTYIDFSNEENRRKFISANGMPMYLGPDGSLATGNAPDIFLTGDVADWHINKGTGGGFTENGTLTEATSSPGKELIDADCTGLGDNVWNDPSTGHCYFGVTATPQNNTNAQSMCSAQGGYLAELTSADELTNVVANIGTNEYWIGGSDADVEGQWYWKNGELADVRFWSGNGVGAGGVPIDGNYNFWRTGEPDAWASDEDCIMMNLSGFSTGAGEWVDYGCTGSKPYLCEIGASDDCANPTGAAGDILYNTDEKVVQYCNGVDWVAMGPVGGTGGGGCASPSGSAGDIMFNSAWDVMQYCNSEDWVAIGKAKAPTDGLLGYWKFDETGATTTAADSSGNGFDGTMLNGLSGTNTASGLLGSALNFDGNDDYVSLNGIAGLYSSTFSVCAWARSTGAGDGEDLQGIVTTQEWPNTGFLLEYYPEATAIHWRVLTSGSGSAYDLSASIDPTQWHHFCGTFDGTTSYLYVDGYLATSIAAAYTPSVSQEFYIGRETWASTGTGDDRATIDGDIDEVRIYDRALSAQEISALYNATR